MLHAPTRRPICATCSTGSAHTRRGGSRSCCPTAGRRCAWPTRPRRTHHRPSPGFLLAPEESGAFTCAEDGIRGKRETPTNYPKPTSRLEDAVHGTLTSDTYLSLVPDNEVLVGHV